MAVWDIEASEWHKRSLCVQIKEQGSHLRIGAYDPENPAWRTDIPMCYADIPM